MPGNGTELFGLIALIGFLALAVHSLWQMSKKRAPATDRLPAGVEGALLAAASLGFVGGIYDAAASGLAFAAADAAGVGPWSGAGAEGFANGLAALAFFWAAGRIFFGRSPRVRKEAAAAFILAGPVMEAVTAWVIPAAAAGEAGMPSPGVDGIAWYLLASAACLYAAWTAYASEQSRNTFGP